MGKKSKRNKAAGGGKGFEHGHFASRPEIPYTPKGKNEIPLYRHGRPDFFAELVEEMHILKRFGKGQTWVCIDDDSFWVPEHNEDGEMVASREKTRQHGKPAECPLCFAPAAQQCSKCNSVYYCGAECQKTHWKTCHKKACKPNPHSYRFHVDINQFRALPDEAFEGHDFIIIKPTEQLGSLAEICDVCLESADDVFEKVPGFGDDQIQPLWTMDNGVRHPIAKAMRKHFGWTSQAHEIGTLEGYRHSEDTFVYCLMYDDNFLNERALAVSYYGDACFPYAREGKHVRGNLVIFKLLIKSKKRIERDLSQVQFIIAGSDDSDLQFEYIMHPITKAEHMLQERRKAIEQGRYTRRQWRFVTRREERLAENESKGLRTLQLP